MNDRPLRFEGFLDAQAIAAGLRDPDHLDLGPVLAAVLDAFGPLGSAVVRPLSMGPGDVIAELVPKSSPAGFLLDLDPPDWRSEWGGLLLFQSGREQVHGYRPVPGALTLFKGSARPLISLITPEAALRTSVYGFWL